jgi:sulfate permease, SulP family
LMRPYLLSAIQGYTRQRFQADLGAGLTVGLVALPLALAIGVASGTKPENGLITGIIGGFLVSLLGGSRVQIGGPAAAFIGLIYATVLQLGFNGLILAVMLSGVLLLAMGYLRVGSLIRYVPDCVVTGFTNGISLLIFIAQIKNFLGLEGVTLPPDTIAQVKALSAGFYSLNLTTLALGGLCLIGLFRFPKTFIQQYKLPPTVCILLLGSLIAPLVQLCGGEKIATIGSAFGGFDASLLIPHLPAFDQLAFSTLVGPAISLALLGTIESLLCARIADDLYNKERGATPLQTEQTRIPEKEKHDSNQELVAQGIANIITPLFGGIATTGTIARTLTNIKSGATSPWAGVIHSITLLIIMLVAAPLAIHIPMTVLAAILIWVSWSMFEPSYHFLGSGINRISATITLLLTVLWGIAPAVGCGAAVYWALIKLKPAPPEQ